MNGATKRGRLLRFSVFEVDLDSGELFKQGRKVKLQGQPFDLLLALTERPGAVITREELKQKVWPSDTVVDFDHGLNRAINKVRQALGDSADSPRFVETIPRRGYRFIGSIQTESSAQPPPGPASPQTTPELLQPGSKTRSRKKVWFIAGVLACVALAVGVAITIASYVIAWRTPPPIVSLPLTSYPGFEKHPSFSPDGRQVTFSWNGEKQDNYDIYVLLTSGGAPLRLTTHPAPDTAPVWSPEGRYIAFIRDPGPNGTIHLISPLGGRDRKIADTKGHSVCWSSDSGSIGMSDETSGLSLVSFTSGERRKLTSAPPGMVDDDCAFSEDGKCLAFLRWSTGVFGSIYVSCPLGANPRRITSDQIFHGLAWMPGKEELLTGTKETGGSRFNLAHVSITGGPTRDPSSYTWGENGSFPSISHPSRDSPLRLVYERGVMDVNLYMLDRGSAQDFSKSPLVAFAPSTRAECDAQFSPDGQKVAFASDRSGELAIWLCDRDGSDLVKLTNLRDRETGSPRWSPDSSRLAFDCFTQGSSHVYLISADGGPARRLTSDSSQEILPSWSHDGRWIYFSSNRSGVPQVWKAPVDGGPAVQVTRSGGYDSFESPDGRLLYYAKQSTLGLWSVPVTGGPETRVMDAVRRFWWAVADTGIYFTKYGGAPRVSQTLNYFLLNPSGAVELDFYSFEKRTVSQVGLIDGLLDGEAPSLAASRDGRRLLVLKKDQAGSDLVLVSNFR